MPIKIYWDDIELKDIIRIDVIGDWTWQEYDEVSLKLRPMFHSVSHRVDIITDLVESGAVPQDPYTSQYIKRGREMRSHNHGLSVNIGGDIISKALTAAAKSLRDVSDNDVRYVDSLEEAYIMIQKDRERIKKTNEKPT